MALQIPSKEGTGFSRIRRLEKGCPRPFPLQLFARIRLCERGALITLATGRPVGRAGLNRLGGHEHPAKVTDMRPAGRDRARSGRAAALAALAIVGLMAASRSMQRAPGSAPAAKALQQRRSSRDVAAAWAGEGDHGPLLDIEVWARPVNAAAAAPSNPLRALLSEKEQRGLVQLCGRCLYHSLKHVTHPRDLGGMTFVATGEEGSGGGG